MINGSEVHIDIYDDRLEIYSPGGMPDGSNIQERDPVTVPSTRRNPVLAEKLYEVQYCDIMAQDTKYLKDRVDYLTTTNYKLKKRRSRLYKKR